LARHKSYIGQSNPIAVATLARHPEFLANEFSRLITEATAIGLVGDVRLVRQADQFILCLRQSLSVHLGSVRMT
jgi:hypothetical protein